MEYDIINEIERITDYIIKIKHHDMNLIDVIDNAINPKLLEYEIEIHSGIPILLARKGYTIVNTDPLVVKKIGY